MNSIIAKTVQTIKTVMHLFSTFPILAQMRKAKTENMREKQVDGNSQREIEREKAE